MIGLIWLCLIIGGQPDTKDQATPRGFKATPPPIAEATLRRAPASAPHRRRGVGRASRRREFRRPPRGRAGMRRPASRVHSVAIQAHSPVRRCKAIRTPGDRPWLILRRFGRRRLDSTSATL